MLRVSFMASVCLAVVRAESELGEMPSIATIVEVVAGLVLFGIAGAVYAV